jgi:hypothetical protein
MGTSPVSQTAPELLAVPIITDHDVLARVSALIEPARRQDRTMWLFFLHRESSKTKWL